MMNIKFRIWDSWKKEMIYPQYQTGALKNQGKHEYIRLFPDGSCGVFDDDKVLPIITIQPDESYVMQFTGLKDKNGKEIYEGDIFDFGFEWVDVITWHPGRCGFGLFCPGKDMWDFDFLDTGVTKKAIEGNIHENSELIK